MNSARNVPLAPRSAETSSSTAGAALVLRAMVELTKVRITVAVTLTTATGYFLAARQFDWDMAMPLLAVFILAAGCAALNQWQERHVDARMKRTHARPLPSGRLDPATAFFVAVLLILIGFYLLASIPVHTHELLFFGGFAVVWYNGVYTYLKRITAFAVVPGALIGAIPPIIGFLAAGGHLHEPTIMLVALFFFIWQIPHFWLLLLMMGTEYRDAGLPTLTNVLARPQLARITFMWMLATAAAGLVFPTLDRVGIELPWNLALVAASIWLAAKSVRILRESAGTDERPRFRRAFRDINVYALAVMVCLSLNALTRHDTYVSARAGAFEQNEHMVEMES